MDFYQLHYFIEVCNSRSYSKAADACFISVPGISKAISRMEDELGTRLFIKTSKGIQMTKQAEFLYDRAVRLLDIYGECMSYFGGEDQKEGYLKMMFTIGSIEEFAGGPLADFKRMYPDIHLQIKEGTDYECDRSVEESEVEMALTTAPFDSQLFESRHMISIKRVVIVGREHKFFPLDGIHIKDLENVPLTMMRETSKIQSILQKACHDNGFDLKIDTLADNLLLLYYLAEKENAACISNMAASQQLSRRNIKSIPLLEPSLDRELLLIWRKNDKLSKEARLFRNLLLQYSETTAENTRLPV